MILLDTNALLWLAAGHKRARSLADRDGLFISPATLLEVKFLVEAGRIALRGALRAVADLADDPRWLVDDPPSLDWFTAALEVEWTRDPFDRLLVAHARVRRWKLATADGEILSRLRGSEVVEL